MKECPVCRSPLFGRPARCGVCETPLSAQTVSATPWALIFTLICPGLGHIWRGHWLSGMIGGFLSLIYSIISFGIVSGGTDAPAVLIVLAGGWLVWVGFWAWDLRTRRRQFLDFSTVTSIVISLLLLINFSFFVNIIMLSIGRT